MARVVVVETVYYQDDGCQPSSADFGYARTATSEQPFTRRMTFSGDTGVERGHIGNCSLMVLKNVGRVPVHVGIYELTPGESLRARPTDLNSVRLSSRSEAKVEVYLYPG